MVLNEQGDYEFSTGGFSVLKKRSERSIPPFNVAQMKAAAIDNSASLKP